jgi:hypothetical protein
MKERIIHNVSEFLDSWRVEQDPAAGTTWFRGQSDHTWKLLPGLLRQKLAVSETTLLTRFRQSAAMLAHGRPENSFDWMFLMQHYGIKTRLLDWSESPLVALYFAVSGFEQHPNVDAAMWCLWPRSLNFHAHIVDRVEGAYIPSFHDEELQNYATESVRISMHRQLFPVATIATRNNPRIQAQMGTFTIHHSHPVPIEEIGDGNHVLKYIIPDASREHVLKDLRLLGFNRFSLFPELESVSDNLKELMQ